MSTSLENRSSLRKLEFPHCTIEALKRLLATCKTVSHKLPSLFEFGASGNRPNPAAFLVLSPKETELVLDIIDEFVFFTKASKTKKITTQLQELQLLQIIVEFYAEKLSEVADSLELNESTGSLLLLTNYLFMDSNPKADQRAHLMTKFTSLALGLKNRPVLHCLGLWLQQQQSSNHLAFNLVENVQKSFMYLVSDPKDSLNNLPNISAVFAANFVISLTELYCSSEKWPDTSLIEICNQWMDSRSQLMEISGPSLLIGLSRWTILHPLINKCQNPQEESQYAQLHLSILETVADLKKPMFVPNKAMISLISKLEDTLNRTELKCDLGSQQELAMDRLGQVLHCFTSMNCLQSKPNDICQSLKKLKPQNRLIQMYLQRYN